MTLGCWRNIGKRKLVDVLNGFEKKKGGRKPACFLVMGGEQTGL